MNLINADNIEVFSEIFQRIISSDNLLYVYLKAKKIQLLAEMVYVK